MIGGFEDFHFAASDGLRLHARVYQASRSQRVPVICLPGLTRNARDFHDLALFLSLHPRTPRSVIALDSRGRGLSDRDADARSYTVAVEANDVLSLLAARGIARGAFIGTSRGGLVIHVLAAIRADLFKAVVLNDIGPELGMEGLAHISRYLNTVRAPETFEDAEALQRSIHGQAFPALGEADWKRMAAAIYRNQDGRPVGDFDPAIGLALKTMDLAQALPSLWPQFDALKGVPLMVIRGANSKLLTGETVSEMKRRRPDLEAVEVAGQGHPPMLESGDLPERIAAFLARADGA